jgi:hypothetical protein
MLFSGSTNTSTMFVSEKGKISGILELISELVLAYEGCPICKTPSEMLLFERTLIFSA